MRNRLLRVLDKSSGGLFAFLAVLLYIALLAGRGSLGAAYLPVVAALALALAAAGLRWLSGRVDILAGLRSAAPALLLGGLAALALALRLWRAPQPAPAPGSDESFFIEAALGIIRTGQYVPAGLRYPSLLVYVELAASVLRFVSGASANLWTWPTQLVPANLYGWGRGAVALLSAATLLPAYRIGERLFSRTAGLLAAFFLALLPMHLAAGGIVSAEALAALLALLTTWFALRLLEEGLPRWALLAGACAGLAVATHYPAAVVLLVPLLAAVLRGPAPRATARRTLVLFVLLAALASFVVACPAALFHVDRLVAGLAESARAYFPAQGTAGSGLNYLLRDGLGWGPALLVLLGAALLVPRFRRADAVLFAFPVLLYLALLLPRARQPRDLVLIAPYLALLAAVGVDRAGARLQERLPAHAAVRWLPWGMALVSGVLFVWALL